MVRHGRLSKGCQTCRKRKIKCDQLRPSCSQCRKAGWVCPQYGDTVERMFQYHDPDRFNTHQALPSQDSGHTVTILQPADRPSVRNGTAYGRILSYGVTNEIRQSLNERAIDYFLITNTFHDDAGLRGFYEYLHLYNNMQSSKEVLTSLTAAALAAYGNRFRYGDVLKQARHYYGRSLQLVNRALETPMEAGRNSTMISILLLNTFEGLTSEGPASMAYSNGHMRGVMTVMNLRGQNLMDTRQGQQIFLHMGHCLITYSIIRIVRVPADFIVLRKHAAKFLDTNNPAWVLEEIMIKIADLRAGINDGSIPDCRSIVDLALQLDSQLSSLLNGMPLDFRFDTFKLREKSESHHPTHHHVYPDLWVAYTWNYLRTCRLLLHKEIGSQLAQLIATSQSLSTEEQNLWTQSRRTVHALITDICASVPQYGDQISPDKTAGHGNTYMAFNGATGPVPTVAGVYFLLWPLLIAGSMTECGVQRGWIINQCRHLGRISGIQRMTTVADTLDRGGEALL